MTAAKAGKPADKSKAKKAIRTQRRNDAKNDSSLGNKRKRPAEEREEAQPSREKETSFVRGVVTRNKFVKREAHDTSAIPGNLFGEHNSEDPKSRPNFLRKGAKLGKNRTDKKSVQSGKDIDRPRKKKPIITKQKLVEVGVDLLGVIEKVNDMDLTVRLPNGTLGMVSFTDINEYVTKKAVSLLEGEDTEAQGDVPDLDQFFAAGSVVRCVVTKIEKGPKRKVSLSLDPALLNKALTPDNVLVDMVLPGYVESVEDHGFVIGLGINGLVGFLSKDDVGGGLQMVPGRPVNCVVNQVNGESRTVGVSVQSHRVTTAIAHNSDGREYGYDTVRPGMLVMATVVEASQSKLTVAFLGGLKGTIQSNHVRIGLLKSDDLAKEFPPKSQVKARVLTFNPSVKKITLSLLPHILENRGMMFSDVMYGALFENVPIVRNDVKRGLLMRMPETCGADYGYVNIKRVADSQPERLTDKPYMVGQRHTVRVVGKNSVDGLLTLSMKESILAKPFLSYDEIAPGQVVEGTVSSISDTGVQVHITDYVSGLCPVSQLADINITTHRKKYKIGMKFKCRVLQVKTESRKLYLTHKPTLVTSTLPLLTSFETASVGLVTHGYVIKVTPKGAVVGFYNRVTGLLPLADLVAAGLVLDQLQWRTVKVVVTRVNPTRKRIDLALQVGDEPIAVPARAATKKMTAGTMHTATSIGLGPDGVLVTIEDCSEALVLPANQLTDHPNHAALLAKYYSIPGKSLDKVMALTNGRPPRLQLTAKASLIGAVQSGRQSLIGPGDMDIEPGTLLLGYVHKIEDFGVFIRFPGGAHGFCTMSDLDDRFTESASALLSVGQTVMANVLSVDKERHNLRVSLKPSSLLPTGRASVKGESDAILSLVDERRIILSDVVGSAKENVQAFLHLAVAGTPLDSQVVSAKKEKVTLQMAHGYVGIVNSYQCRDVAVKTGDTILSRVLALDLNKKAFYVTVRAELVHQSEDIEAVQTQITRLKEKKERKEPVAVVVELILDQSAVLSFSDYPGLLALALLNDYSTGRVEADAMTLGKTFTADVVSLPSSPSTRACVSDIDYVSVVLHMDKGANRAPSTLSYALPETRGITDVRQMQNMKIQGKVLKVVDYQAHVQVNKHVQGRIFVNEVAEHDQLANKEKPLERIKVGDVVTAWVIGLHDVRSHSYLPFSHPTTQHLVAELTMRESALSASNGQHETSTASKPALKKGDRLTVFVQNVSRSKLVVFIDQYTRAFIPAKLISSDSSVTRIPAHHFSVGMALKAEVYDVTEGRTVLRLVKSERGLKIGEEVEGTVIGLTPGAYVAVKLVGHHKPARLQVTDISAVYTDDVMTPFVEGHPIKARIADITDTFVYLSTRPAEAKTETETEMVTAKNGTTDKKAVTLDKEITKLSDLRKGMKIRGFVSKISDDFLFAVIGRNIAARAPIKSQGQYTLGQVVTGTITKVKDGKVDLALHRIKGEGKKNSQDATNLLAVKDIVEGMTLDGKVTSIETYGVFVQLQGVAGRATGLAHRTEASDADDVVLTDLYTIGDLVKAKVLKVEKGGKRISLGLKRSYFEGTEENEDKMEVDQEAKTDLPKGEEEQSNLGDQSGPSRGQKRKEPTATPLAVSVGFGFDDSFGLTVTGAEGLREGDDHSTDEESDSQSNAVGDAKRPSKRAKKSSALAMEEHVRETEKALLSNTTAPKTADDFERLLMANPNSSYLWVNYMALFIGQGEVEKARRLADTALKRIEYRKENERLNVWKALLNLEAQYGSQASVEECFSKAVQANDPKTIYMHLAHVYETTGKEEELHEHEEKTVRRFGSSKKVWTGYLLRLVKKHKTDDAMTVLRRALQCLPKRKHMALMVKFAQMHFKYGDPEKARTMFEEIVAQCPKRADLWSIYIDMENNAENVKGTRQLFERVTSVNLSTKKMKSFLKRWLEFEKNLGGDAEIEHVKEKARLYVTSKLQQ